MNQYRCETCKKYSETEYLSFCDGLAFRDNLDSTEKEYIKEWIEKVGCASHSSQQSERNQKWESCKQCNNEVCKDALIAASYDGFHDGEIVGEQSGRETVLKQLHSWFNNYCEGNEEPDLWMAFIKAEFALRQELRQDGKDGEWRMKGYRKIEDTPLSFDKIMDLAEDDLFQQEEQLRGVLGKISAHAEKTGIREYQIVVYAKRRKEGKDGE